MTNENILTYRKAKNKLDINQLIETDYQPSNMKVNIFQRNDTCATSNDLMQHI